MQRYDRRRSGTPPLAHPPSDLEGRDRLDRHGTTLLLRKSPRRQPVRLALTYLDLAQGNPLGQQQVYAECRTERKDDDAEKRHLWSLFKPTPEPGGYDPALFFQAVDNPEFGLLKLIPWRIIMSLSAETSRPARNRASSAKRLRARPRPGL